MVDFLQLVRNENMKIYRRPRTWVMTLIMVTLVLFISIMWRIFSKGETSMWDVISMESFVLFLLVTIFTVVVSAGSVAEEFTSGTIKLLLIRPWSRSKVLLSKYISNALYAALLTIILFASSLLLNWLLFGLNPSDTAKQSTVPLPGEMAPFAYLLKFYGMKFITLMVTMTLAFMLSTIFRSSGLAIGLSLFLLLGVNSFVPLLAMLDYEWINYLLFMHLDLTKYIGSTVLEDGSGSSLGFSLSIIGAYYVLFIALTWYVFNKRDISA